MNPILYNTRKDLKKFLLRSFHELNPGSEYMDNWHIDLILEYLQAISNNEIKRLLINIPPRSLKSLCVSAVWPAWLLGHDPSKRIIVASYSKALSIKHSEDTRVIMQSDWYQDLFPEAIIAKGRNQQSKFVTTKHGFRFATSIGSTLTGEGADILIADDPQTPIQMRSSVQRERAIQWFEQTFSTRLNCRKKGAIIVVMQRLHPNDISGALLEKDLWTHLKLPAISDDAQTIAFGSFQHQISAGEILHKNRISDSDMEMTKKELGSYAFNAQYQQNPLTTEGSIIKISWIKKYNDLPDGCIIYQSWDCGAKTGELNDYTVCTTWGFYDNRYYLIDVFRGKFEFPDLKKNVMKMYDAFSPSAVLIEDKLTGHSLIQDIEYSSSIPIIKIIPKTSKRDRLIGVSSMFEAGRVLIASNKIWLAELESELINFPSVKYDDQVDSITQFLIWMREKQIRERNAVDSVMKPEMNRMW